MAEFTMSPRDRDKLKRNRVNLVRNMHNGIDFYSILERDDILTESMVEEIRAPPVRHDQNAKLLDTLVRRGPTAFKAFIHALMDTKQAPLARMLDSDLATWWEKENAYEAASPMQTVVRNSSPPKKVDPPRRPPSRKRVVQSTADEESGLLIMQMQPYDGEAMAQYINDSEHVYKMTARPRGRALIFNNSYFVEHTQREGANFDSVNLDKLFSDLSFDTCLYEDLTAEEMQETLMEESRREDHYNACALVVFILSHGARGHVYGIDGGAISVQSDVIAPFDGMNCPALRGKPKMFFIQACQGALVSEGVDGGQSSQDDSQTDASPLPAPLDPQLTRAFQELQIQDREEDLQFLSRTHEKADIVIAYSTVPGYRSWRRADLGSWFVRAIVKVFSESACIDDLLSLLVKVRQKVSENETQHTTDRSFIQLTRTDEYTRKKIFFFPGYYEQRVGDTV